MAQPKTMQHMFALTPLRAHFNKTPNPPAANKLIDLPADTFLDTEEEITVIAAALWMLSVKYDAVEEKDRPKDLAALRKWIDRGRIETIKKLSNKVEPPFTAWSVDQMTKDVGAMMEELLAKTLPPEVKNVDAAKTTKKD